METLDLFFFKRVCYYQNASYRKNESNKSCRQTFDLQSWFCSFLAQNSPIDATDLARNGPKFPWGPRLEAFTARLTFPVLNSCFSLLWPSNLAKRLSTYMHQLYPLYQRLADNPNKLPTFCKYVFQNYNSITLVWACLLRLRYSTVEERNLVVGTPQGGSNTTTPILLSKTSSSSFRPRPSPLLRCRSAWICPCYCFRPCCSYRHRTPKHRDLDFEPLCICSGYNSGNIRNMFTLVSSRQNRVPILGQWFGESVVSFWLNYSQLRARFKACVRAQTSS